MDPKKFIERHFGMDNPDIIFQEVITEVPDPVVAYKTIEEDIAVK